LEIENEFYFENRIGQVELTRLDNSFNEITKIDIRNLFYVLFYFAVS